MKLTDYELEKLARLIAQDLREEVLDKLQGLVKKQLKEVAFQLTLFADTMDD